MQRELRRRKCFVTSNVPISVSAHTGTPFARFHSLPPRIDGRQRVVIEDVAPEIDAGRFRIKRTVGESVRVRAAVFADGHDEVSCHVLYRSEGEEAWQSEAMKPLGNDLWEAEFRVWKMGRCRYTVEGWIDRFKTWRADLKKRNAAGQGLSVELAIGAGVIAEAA